MLILSRGNLQDPIVVDMTTRIIPTETAPLIERFGRVGKTAGSTAEDAPLHVAPPVLHIRHPSLARQPIIWSRRGT